MARMIKIFRHYTEVPKNFAGKAITNFEEPQIILYILNKKLFQLENKNGTTQIFTH